MNLPYSLVQHKPTFKQTSAFRLLFRRAVRIVLEMCLDEAAKELVGARQPAVSSCVQTGLPAYAHGNANRLRSRKSRS